MYQLDTDDPNDDEYDKEIADQTSYSISVRVKLNNLSVAENVSVPSLPENMKLPEIKCDTFSGENSSVLQYHTFKNQFMNIVGSRVNLSKTIKLTYLKSYLRGYAFKLVQHLQIVEDNYDIALNLLDSEFMNKNAVIDELLKRLKFKSKV